MSVDSPGFTSELEAVNILLTAVGESPVSMLEGVATVDVALARSTLAEVSREVQSRGWHFNEEDAYSLAPDAKGEIRLPLNACRVDLDERLYPRWDVIQRGGRLYSKSRHSYHFDRALSATLRFILPWDELPQPARHYITTRAARMFADRLLGEPATRRALSEDETQALVALKQYDADNADWNVLDNPCAARVVGGARRHV